MNSTRLGSTLVVGAVAVTALTSCATDQVAQAWQPSPTKAPAELFGTINGAGASSQGSAQETWIAAFRTANHDVTINYHPTGSGAGTTKNFAEYLHAYAPTEWNAEPADTFPFRAEEGAQSTSGVADTVKNGVGTISYADASKAGGLSVAKIKVGGEFVAYSAEAAAAIVDASPMAEGREPGDIAINLDRSSTAAGVYPIVLVSYLIACQVYADPTQAALVKNYLSYVASPDGQAQAAEFAGSAPISAALQVQVQEAIDSIR